MNDDPLETRLQALRRRDTATAWKASILAIASAEPRPQPPSLGPPRWLACGLAAIWALVIALHFQTPSAALRVERTPATPDPVPALQQRQELIAALLSTTTPPSP